MSWINSRQHAGGQPPPPATPQSGSVGFGGSSGIGGGASAGPAQQLQQQQCWPQQQQLLTNFNYQTQQYPQSQSDNLFSTQPTRPNTTQSSWQQQPMKTQQQQLPQTIQPLSNQQYFNKQNPVVDGYMQQNLVAPLLPVSNHSTPQHYNPQQNQNNFFQQNPQNPGGINSHYSNASSASSQQSFVQSEPQLSSTTTATAMASAVQEIDNQPPQKNEGWDDWDWNDNKQSAHQQADASSEQLQQNAQNVAHQDMIANSFAAVQTDVWKWNSEDTANSNEVQNANANECHKQFMTHEQQQQAMDSYGGNSLGLTTSSAALEESLKPRPPSVGSAATGVYVQNVMQPPQFSAQQTQQTLQQPQPIGQQRSLSSQQSHPLVSAQTQSPSMQQPPVSVQHSQPTPITSSLISDSPTHGAANNVYVSQAKPVSQPARQYALSPPVVPNTVNSNQTDLPPPPASNSATSILPPPPINQTPPPPPALGTSGSNPYKRAGAAQYHRVPLTSSQTQQPVGMQSEYLGPVSGDFQQTGNQEYLAPDNSEVILENRSFEVENQEVAPSNETNQHHEVTPSNDRNQYLQTDHLSEEGYNNVEMAQELNEQDSLPPPGLSRLVLGEPEHENAGVGCLNENAIPPGLDRMVPGTELVTAGINMERQADGQDTIPAPRSAFSNVPPVAVDNSSSNIDITADRNLYLVPGESDMHEQQRIVTGLEIESNSGAPEQREVELDGENLEDQQQLQQQQQQQSHQQQHYQGDMESRRDEPIEGANTLDSLPATSNNHDTESSQTHETNQKDMSNPSTCNDESDHKGRHSSFHGKSKSRKADDKRRLASGNDGKDRKERYETESDYYSSDRDRKFREGSVRGDRDRKSKDRDRRDRREGSARDQERYRDDDDDRESRRYDRERQRGKHDRDRDRDRDRNGRYNNTRYETDSKYETEASTRYERRRGGDRDRDRDRNRQDHDYRRDEKEKRYRRGGADRPERAERDERDRRRGETDRDYRDRRRGDRGRGGGSSNEFEDDTFSRRTASSRNDREYKDRSLREVKDARYAGNAYGYPPGYGYDAYSYYQHQQYYEQLRRTNPQAYAEWYRKYYAQLQNNDMIATHDGRESVHSGRSSANNDKDRYNYQHPYFHQQLPTNEYQHHNFGQPLSIGSSLNSTTIEEHLNGGASTGNLSQYRLQQYQQQQQQAGSSYPVASSARSYYSKKDYLDIRSGQQFNASLNIMDGASTIQEPQRLTPCKFINDHSIATLANGLMLCVKPKYASNGITNIVKVWKFAPNDSTRRLFNSFPGPLVRGITHKKTIIEFCEDQIRLGPPSLLLRSRNNSVSSICSMGQANRASFTLMWTLLILLLRQNGMVVGTDIAELLMKNKSQYPYEATATNANANKSGSGSRRNSIQSDQKKSHDNQTDEDDINSIEDKEDDSDESDAKKSLSEDNITEKFRNHLLYGNVNEALEWATDNNLWGHALFLASKVDRRLHANVMMKFANKLTLNDPLQTLYQLMSGRTPSSVTSVQDEKWGDWRPHLAMILSNTSQRPDLDRKAITTLGDSLYNRGDLFGAQFCYLMAQVGFGRYSSVNQESSFISNSMNAIRLVLLGSSHHKTFREFATNEAIMMTEIYEYACALNDEKFSLVEFQPYKYLLASRMLDYGMQLKTLTYMEQISRHIQLDPSKYDISFIEKVCTLSDRLKFVDPMLEKSMDDQETAGINHVEEQPWLQSLRVILNESNMYAAQQLGEIPTRSQIDQQFAEINQQFSALNTQYENFESRPDQQQQQQQQQVQATQPQSLNDPQYQLQYQQQISNNGMESGPQSKDQYGQYYNSGQEQMMSLPGQSSATSDYSSYGPQSYEPQSGYEQSQYQQFTAPETQQQHQDQQAYSGYWDQQTHQTEPSGQSKIGQASSAAVAAPTQSPQLTASTPTETILVQTSVSTSVTPSAPNTNSSVHSRTNNAPMFDSNTVPNQKKLAGVTASATIADTDQSSLEPKRSTQNLTVSEKKQTTVPVADPNLGELKHRIKMPPPPTTAPPASISNSISDREPSRLRSEDTLRPQISMPNASNKPGYFDDGTSKVNSMPVSSSNAKDTDNLSSSADKKVSASKSESKKQSSNTGSTGNSGWFGGIWNKLSLKPKNQMILPDDKNPAIVWDPDKKRWINTDGDEVEQESFKPPPKMADIVQNAYNTNLSRQSSNNNDMAVPNQHQQQTNNYGPPDVPMMSTMPSSNTIQSSTSPGLIPSATNAGNSMSASGNAGSVGSTTTGTATGEPITKTPSLQSNMFKMQRNRTLKKSYVDVFNPSGAPTKPIEPVLAPILPTATVPQGNIFVPAPISNDDGSAQQQPQEGMPQFYNPNQFSGGYQ